MSHWADLLRSNASHLPLLVRFVFFLIAVAGIPPLCERFRLPAVVGLLVFGIIIGPHGIPLVEPGHPVVSFFADLGKILLMFLAGLEINLSLFRAARNRTIVFGITTTFVPLILGTLVALKFGYAAVPAIVIGSLLASHTLLTSSYLSEIRAVKLEPVTVTMGATMMSDTLSLLVFAVCVQTFTSGFSAAGLFRQIIEIAIFIPVVLFGLSRLGARALKRVEHREDAYLLIVLIFVSIAAVLAQAIQLPEIVGAFFAGLSLNEAMRESPVKEKLEFIAKTLFIPAFFISIGFLINPIAFIHSLIGNIWMAISIVLALVVGKAIAADSVGRAFKYTSAAKKTMWSMTLPQVAATLAATLVAVKTQNSNGQTLLDGQMMNVVLVLVVTTSIVGPTLTERFAPDLVAESQQSEVGKSERKAA